MRTNQFQFIDEIIDQIPVIGTILGDLFYTFAGLNDAMNLRQLAQPVAPLPPGDNVVLIAPKLTQLDVRKAA